MESSDYFGLSLPGPSYLHDDESGSQMSRQDSDKFMNVKMECSDHCYYPAPSPSVFIDVSDCKTESKMAHRDRENYMNEEKRDVEDLPIFAMDEQGDLHRLSESTSRDPTPPPHKPSTSTLPPSDMFLLYKEERAEAADEEQGPGSSIGCTEYGKGSSRKIWRRRFERVVPVCETDKDVTPELGQCLRTLRENRERCAQQSRKRRNVKLRKNFKVEHECVPAESTIADELFGGDNSALEFEWLPMASFPHTQETFKPVNCPGPRQPTSCAYEAFRQFWDDEILDHIVLETNRYASQLKLTSTDYANNWYDTNVHEILTLFAFWMMLAIIHMPTINSCFSRNRLLQTTFFKTIFTKHRYWLLNGALHFTNNAMRNRDSSKAFSLGPVFEHLNNKFSECYTLSQDISIDESLTLWKGNLSFKQYIKTKAARFGIKTFELCESKTGYLWSFVPYLGKQTPQASTRIMPKATEVVVELIRPLLNQGYRVFMDNWYNSPLLARFLKRNGTDCVGTIRKNLLNLPPLIKLANLERGQCVARHCGDVAVMAYQDNNTVFTISTHHGTEDVLIPAKPRRPAQYKPAVIHDYNMFMGGVDRKDQMLEPYLIERKRCKKWYKKLFKRYLNASILNSRILVGRSVDSNQQQLAFRLELVDRIVKRHMPYVPVIRQVSDTSKLSCPNNRLNGSHFITRIPKEGVTVVIEGNRRQLKCRHQCDWCKERHRRYKKTTYMCDNCQVPLCLDECFKNYHTVR